MKETRKRGIRATTEGQQKLRSAKAAKRNHNNKVWTYLDIATAAEVNETTVKRFFGGKDNVDKESALSIVKSLNLDITEIVDPNEWNTLTIAPTDIDWRDICDRVLETQQLRRQATAQQYELNIYVPLGLMERPKTPNPRPNPFEEDLQRQQEPELQIVQTYKDDAFFQKVIAENRTEKGKQIAIIGEPGAGKTTLLGKLAERLPNNSPDLPICIRLADLRESTIADYLLNNWLKKALPYIDADAENVTPEIKKALKQLFAEGKVWLLLDGVDEMAATSPVLALAKIREQLTDWVGKARVVLTCRVNVWNATISNTLTNFDTYKTLEFEPDDVEEFICQWFEQASQDEKRRNSGNETFWLEQGKRLQQQLKAPGKERIRELVRNPLRLSMLCQSWCVAERDLPETKAALYEQFTTYFFEWKQEEFQRKHRVLKETDKKHIKQALAKLALAAMESVNRFRIEQDFAIEQMEEQWFDLADELGWLVLVDRDNRTKKPVYAFYHLTFQEYFAACAIEDWHFFLNHQIPPVSSDCYRIFERQWREVILLWLGRGEVERKQKQEFIDALVNFGDGCGEWCNLYIVEYDHVWEEIHLFRIDKSFYEYRAYFLAATAIAEFQDYSQIDKVIEQIVRWDLGYFKSKEQEWVKSFYVVSHAAGKAFPHTPRPKAIDTLVQLLTSGNLSNSTRRRVAESLWKIDPGNQKAIDALVQLLTSGNLDDDTRREVVESLGKIDPGNQKAIDTLVQLLTSGNLSNSTRRRVAESLGNIDPGNPKAIDALVQLLSSPNLHHFTRGEVVKTLGNIDPGNQKAIDALVQLLSYSQLNNYTRRPVAESLGKIGQGNQKAIDALVQLLSSPALDDDTRWQVVKSLGKIGQGNQKAIDALVQMLSSPALDDDTRRKVAESLGNIDPGNPKAIDALVPLLNSPNLDVSTRRLVAESLEKIDPGNQKAIDALVQLLTSGNFHDFTRRQVVESLGKIDLGNQKAIDALVQLLSYPNLHHFTRRQVVKTLGNIDPGNQKAIDALVQLLSYSQLNNYTRRPVAESLGKIGQGNQKAIDALVQLLIAGNLARDTRWQVAESLGKIGQGNQKAIDALVQLLNSPNLLHDYTRWQVTESLGKIGQGNQKAIDALVQLLSSPNLDYSTRRQVVEILKKIQIDKQFAVITALKANFNDSQQIDDNYYKLIWHCSQKMSYPDFYQAWHQDTLTNSATASLNLANLPQILTEAINDRPNLHSKVKLICIDSAKFGNPENPATKIYNEMRLQGCDKSQDGKPKTMAELQDYWDDLRIESEIPLFFICYDSTALWATPTGFSAPFLKAFNKFDRAICVLCEPGDIPLPTFSPTQPNLIADIVVWIRDKMMEQ
jgi:HEAT repeat protein/energy-coupling factor transporter ATP-binding protein EcfA2